MVRFKIIWMVAILFFVRDLNGLNFQVIAGGELVFKSATRYLGTIGCTIGVTDIEKSLKLYRDILGYDKVVFDQTGVFDDWKHDARGRERNSDELFYHSRHHGGGFAKVMGKTYIELAQAFDYPRKKIYEGRLVGAISVSCI